MSEGTKHDSGKAPYHLLPFDAIGEVVRVLDFGARKYAERNWEKGIAYSRVFAAAQRHMSAWWQGEDRDPETGLSHLAHASCCALFLLAFVTRGRKDLDDRPLQLESLEGFVKLLRALGRVEPSPLGPTQAPPRADDPTWRSIGGVRAPGPSDPPVPPPHRVG